MKETIVWFVGSVVTLFCCAAVSVAQSESKYEELPNFHQVSETLYRGAQPKPDGIRRLASLGIRTIINLRHDDAHARAEEIAARAAGLKDFNVPMDEFGRPSEETVEQVLAMINAPENQPVFVHCKRGADRTGTIVAIYRIEHDGWTSERAKSEAKHYGMALWQVGMKHYIDDHYKLRHRPANVSPPSGLLILHCSTNRWTRAAVACFAT